MLSSGLLLLLAYGFVEPKWAYCGYVAATLVGVYPLLRQSLAAWRFGDYFGINTLVAVAALGAIAIGQAPEGAVVVFFFAIGELLEDIAAGRARAGIRALGGLTPKRLTCSRWVKPCGLVLESEFPQTEPFSGGARAWTTAP